MNFLVLAPQYPNRYIRDEIIQSEWSQIRVLASEVTSRGTSLRAVQGVWEPKHKPLGAQTDQYLAWFAFVSLIWAIFLSIDPRIWATCHNSEICQKLPFSAPKFTIKSQVWWAGEFIFGDNTHDIALDGLGLGYRVHKHTLLVLSRSQNRPFEPMIIFRSPL